MFNLVSHNRGRNATLPASHRSGDGSADRPKEVFVSPMLPLHRGCGFSLFFCSGLSIAAEFGLGRRNDLSGRNIYGNIVLHPEEKPDKTHPCSDFNLFFINL